MTIAIAIACTDGVVVASDSMGASGRHATPLQKVFRSPNSSILWVSSGTDYLTALVRETIQSALSDHGQTPADYVELLDPVIREAHGRPLKLQGDDSIEHSVDSLLVGYVKDQPVVIHLPADLAVLDCRDKTLVAIGSAHDYAHVVATSLRHHFDGQISIHRAELLAYRIVKVVCDASSWGVAPPIQMGVVDEKGARVLSQLEVEEIALVVERWNAVEAEQFTGEQIKLGPDEELPTLAIAESTPESSNTQAS